MSPNSTQDGTRGLLWSHLLASILGGLLVAGALLAFGVIGDQRTETVPINESATPVPDANTDGMAQDIYADDAPGVVQVSSRSSMPTAATAFLGPEPRGARLTGSGFLIAERGYVLTAYHLVAGVGGNTGITVTFDAGVSRPARLLSYDSAEDVALLQVSMIGISTQIQPLTLGDSSEITAGDTALTIANPYGLDRTLASGIVSALQRELPGPVGSGTIDNVIETDIPAGAGVSGSPLLDDGGNVIGVNTALVGGGTRTPFAVPIDVVRDDPAFRAAIMSIHR